MHLGDQRWDAPSYSTGAEFDFSQAILNTPIPSTTTLSAGVPIVQECSRGRDGKR